MRRPVSIILALLLACLACAVAAHGEEQAPPVGASPLPEEVVVSCMQGYSPLTHTDAEGEPAGLLVDLWRLWSRETGVPVRFVFGTWSGSLEAVRSGRADVHSGLFRTASRLQWLDFSQPFYAVESGLLVSTRLGRVTQADLDGLRIGVIRGSYQEQYLREHHPGLKLRAFDQQSAMYRAVAQGEVDGFLGEMPSALTKLDALGLTGRFAPVPGVRFSEKLYAAVAKGDDAMLALVDRGLSAISVADIRRMEAGWIRDPQARYYQPGVSLVRLTAREEAWLAGRESLRVAVDPEMGPLVMSTERGELAGMVPDVLDMLGRSTGVRFELAPADGTRGALKMVARGEADAALAARGEAAFLDLDMVETRLVLQSPTVIVTRVGEPFIADLSDLSGSRVAVADGDPRLEELRREHGDVEVEPARDVAEALEMVAAGDAFAAVAGLDRAAYVITREGLGNLKVAARVDLARQGWVLAVRPGDALLAGVLDKALDALDPGELERLQDQWLRLRLVREEDGAFVRLAVRIGLAALLAGLVLLIWNRRLGREVRERRAAEQALRQAEQRFRAIYENAPAGIFQTTLRGELVRLNPELVRIGGYDSAKQALEAIHDLGRDWYVDPGDRDEMVRIIREQGQVRDFEYQARRRDGTVIWVSLSARLVRDDKGRPSTIDGFILDITSRKQAEEALLKRFGVEKLISSLSTRFLNLPPEQLDEAVNRALGSLGEMIGADRCYVFSFSRDMSTMNHTHQWVAPGMESFGRSMADVPVDKAPWFRDVLFSGGHLALDSLEEVPEAGARERKAWEKEGIRSLAVVPMRYQKRLLGFLCCDTIRSPRRWTTADVAFLETMAGILVAAMERIRHEREIVLARDEAFAANRAKSAFLAGMSHEIRTPLNAILGMAEVLSESELSEEQHKYVRVFRQAAQTLLELIDDILDLSKVEAGRVELERIPFDLRDVVAQAVAPHEMSARRKELGFTLRLDPSLPSRVSGDPTRIRQVLSNLAGNAVKFTHDGGVEVAAAPDPETAGRVRFTVRDTGIGIPHDKQQSIFETFVQADATTTRRYGGTGLGLSICRRLTELMGGEIGVESEPGSGSLFHVSLPLAPEPATETEAEGTGGAPEEPDLTGLKVLIADDSEFSRVVLQAYLKDTGSEPSEARDGQETVERWQAGSFGLVLLDMQMPVMDGFDAVQRIRELERRRNLPRTPIIAFTAYASRDEQRQCREAGCDAVLTKPVRRADLLAAMAATLGKNA